MLKKFLEFKNEAEGTKQFALIALLIITVSLAMLSICGAWANSEGDWLAFIPRFFYSFLVLGLELLAAVLFVRALIAAHWAQAVVCCGMLLFLAWANVQNAKDGVHFIFPTRFGETGQTLNEKANLAAEQAGEIKTAASIAVASIPDQLADARSDLAKLEAEQNLMRSQTRVREAQHHLQSLGLYRGDIDGIYRSLTKEAMLARGDMIRSEMEVLRNKITNLESGAPVSTTATANNDKRVEEIETRAAAREANSAAWRLEVILWVAEIARSLGLWAAVTSVSARQTSRLRKLQEDIEAARLEAELAALRGQKPPAEPEPESVPEPEPAVAAPEPPPPPIPEPVEAVPEPEPPPPPPEPETPREAIRGRPGGLATGHVKGAAKAKSERLILVPSLVARDAEREAAKIAAQ